MNNLLLERIKTRRSYWEDTEPQFTEPEERQAVTIRYNEKNGWIEAKPVIKVLKKWLSEQDPYDGNGFSKVRELSPLWQLSHWTGIKHDTLFSYTTRNKDWMEFDSADKIICCTYGPMMWRQDEELERIYQGFDFTSLDEKRPTTRAA